MDATTLKLQNETAAILRAAERRVNPQAMKVVRNPRAATVAELREARANVEAALARIDGLLGIAETAAEAEAESIRGERYANRRREDV